METADFSLGLDDATFEISNVRCDYEEKERDG